MSIYQPTNCPRCESEQLFVPKMKASEHGWLEEYIRCSVCRYEISLRTTTSEIEMITVRCRELAERARWEMNRHGATSSTLVARINSLEEERSKLIGDLAKEVVAHGKSAHSDAT